MSLVEQAMTGWWGEKCDSYEKGCPTCDAWKEYEELLDRTEQLERELDQLTVEWKEEMELRMGVAQELRVCMEKMNE